MDRRRRKAAVNDVKVTPQLKSVSKRLNYTKMTFNDFRREEKAADRFQISVGRPDTYQPTAVRMARDLFSVMPDAIAAFVKASKEAPLPAF